MSAMKIIVTGAAGFIGFHTVRALLARGDQVVGIDNLNDYYDPALKQARLDQLLPHDHFTFHKIDIADTQAVADIFAKAKPDKVLHLAAQAGVRYSIDNPHAYIHSNIIGHLNILESCRHHADSVTRLVYASSSSVYGGNEKKPFAVTDRVDHPVSLYATTKKSDELMSHCYAHLYGVESVGLRFFTVYGTWGRPDMAYFSFTDKIMRGEEIPVFNHGDMKRDFTFIDDVVSGILAALDRDIPFDDKAAPHKIYNLGNHKTESLGDFIAVLETACGKTAIKKMLPMQPGDVYETYADIDVSHTDLGYNPQVTIAQGLPKFVDWYKNDYKK